MTWKIDPIHSEIGFKTKHMMVATVKGKFHEFHGDLVIDENDLSKSGGTIRINAGSIDTNFEQRDNHLKSADFLDVESSPEIVFASNKIERKGEDVAISGDLTIRGVSRPVTFKGEVAGPLKDPWGNPRLALSAEAQVNRKDWNLNWNQALEAGGFLVSDKVTLQIDLELSKIEA
jgi:polyisoprenoid-binding protein YceI